MEFKPECRCCHTAMKVGFLVNVPEGDPGKFNPLPITVTNDWKCPACGHSFVPRIPTPPPALTTP